MGQMASENEPTGTEEEVGSQEVSTPTGGNDSNPAWQELLSVVPEELHEQVKPHLQKWDQNFDQVQSKYSPYKSFAEQNISPDDLQYAYQVARQMETDPMQMIKALTDYAKENDLWQDENPVAAEEDGQGLDDEGLPDITQHPKFVELQQLVETIGSQLIQERQAQQEAQEDQELNETLDSLTEELGEFDREWVLQKALQDLESGQEVDDLKPYVEKYRQFEQSIIEKSKRPAPKLLPSGGQAPQNQIDPRTLTDAERRKFIVDRISLSQQD